MKAMILAAGRGERMRPLTDTCPKPLLQAGPHRLIEHQILALEKAGISEIVINTAWLANQIHATLGDGKQYKVNIRYSDEGDPALETAGGIVKALPLLGDQPFILVNGDIYTDFDYSLLCLPTGAVGHLILVENPPHHPDGDFGLSGAWLTQVAANSFTYSGIAVFDPSLFANLEQGRMPLKPVLDTAIGNNKISGQVFRGEWYDIGTAQRLEELNKRLTSA